MPPVRLIEARLPDFGFAEQPPTLPVSLYAERAAALDRARVAAGLDALLIYADREHCANLAWLTGFDPRFEEALLVWVAGRQPMLLTGPENLGRAQRSSIPVDARLYPPFGLMGQDRTRTEPLADLLTNAGLTAGQAVGVLGWKYFGPHEAADPAAWIEAPSFIVDTLRRLVGSTVLNANALLMHPTTGLRAVVEIAQLAHFEHAATTASEAIKSLLAGLIPGMSEFDAVRLMQLPGLPHSCHVMLSDGRASGLASPSERRIELGQTLTTAIGFVGALSCRAGFVARDRDDLPPEAADYLERVAVPYFAAAAEWYETIGIGVAGGTLDALVRRHLGSPFFNLILNPGHLIHLDEWMNTPVYPGSTELLRSGQAIQVDIIPAIGPPYFGSNIEDGIALLDAPGRDALRSDYPAMFERCMARRAFMADVLGVRLKPEVLPLSNLAGALMPYMLSPGLLLSKACAAL